MIFLENKAIGSGPVKFPDEPGVTEFYQARGWVKVDGPKPEPFVPAKSDGAPDDTGWVQLVHSQTGATHDFPSNAEAIEGAAEAGWDIPPSPEPETDQPPAPSKTKTKASMPPATDETKE
jgi:hypothetical protein